MFRRFWAIIGSTLLSLTLFTTCSENPSEPETPPKYLGSWGTVGRGDSEFNYPCGIAVAPDGKVFVADWGNGRIQYFSPTGVFLGKWDADARELDFGPDGNLYVISFHNGVYCYTPTGSLIRRWGFEGSGEGGFYQPRDISCSEGGNVYVSDTDHYQIQYFTSTGSFLGSWGVRGSGPGEFYKPDGVVVSPDNEVFVTDYLNRNVQYFSAKGSYLGVFDKKMPSLNGIDVGPEGKIYVADYHEGVLCFTPRGSFQGTIAEEGFGEGKVVNADAVAISTKGVIYVTDIANNCNACVQYYR